MGLHCTGEQLYGSVTTQLLSSICTLKFYKDNNDPSCIGTYQFGVAVVQQLAFLSPPMLPIDKYKCLMT